MQCDQSHANEEDEDEDEECLLPPDICLFGPHILSGVLAVANHSLGLGTFHQSRWSKGCTYSKGWAILAKNVILIIYSGKVIFDDFFMV